jgi:hypothetical protein
MHKKRISPTNANKNVTFFMFKVFLNHQTPISSLNTPPPTHTHIYCSFTVGNIFLTNGPTIASYIHLSQKLWTSSGHDATHIQRLVSEQNTHIFNCDLV